MPISKGVGAGKGTQSVDINRYQNTEKRCLKIYFLFQATRSEFCGVYR